MTNILLIEPFYTGSHKVLIDLLHEELKSREGVQVQLATLTGKKWHWRARTSALYFAQNVPHENFSCIFASCVLPLHELLGLRPDLQKAKKVIYFHENQLVYPVRKSKERDFQYGYNQILSCLAADKVLFNSQFNQESFLSSIKPFFKLQPDNRPTKLREQIQPKCQVLYFPMEFTKIDRMLSTCRNFSNSPNKEFLKIVWPHRWEFDKNPDLFFRVIFRLQEERVDNFRLSILGEQFTDNPPIFTEAQTKLKGFIEHFSYLQSKEDYYNVLKNSDIVVSTADHEFFGVAMLEAVHLGCFPLCPNKLVYPEIFSDSTCLYRDENELFIKLRGFLSNAKDFRELKCSIKSKLNLTTYDWLQLKGLYVNCLMADCP